MRRGSPASRARTTAMSSLKFIILFNCLVSHFQTAGKVQTELGDPRTWLFVRNLARKLFPEDQQPPERPMRWHHYKYVKNRYLSREDTLINYRRIHREGACTLAREAGNFADRGFSIHPTFSNTTAADGKVVATRSKAKPKSRRLDRRTGKRVRARVDPDRTPESRLRDLPSHARRLRIAKPSSRGLPLPSSPCA
jgi:hypothetical protein